MMMSNYTAYMGIDPGLSGAVAIIGDDDSKKQWPHLLDTPVTTITKGKKTSREYDIHDCILLLDDWNPKETHVIIEDVHSSPQMGVVSSFKMGYGLGVWHAAIMSLGFPMMRVRPQEWKKEFGLLKTDKKASMLRAKELFPTADITLAKHDGRADALLMAEYLRRKLNGRTE